MKAQLFFILFLGFGITNLSAQNWAPFYPTDTSNFETDTSTQIKYTVWVDSVTLDGADTVYHFNRIALPCNNCQYHFLLGRKPQFLGDSFTKYTGGKYYFDTPKLPGAWYVVEVVEKNGRVLRDKLLIASE